MQRRWHVPIYQTEEDPEGTALIEAAALNGAAMVFRLGGSLSMGAVRSKYIDPDTGEEQHFTSGVAFLFDSLMPNVEAEVEAEPEAEVADDEPPAVTEPDLAVTQT